MKKNYFSRQNRVGNQFVIEEVKQITYDLLPLVGNAIITHVGGNGRFRFKLNDESYISPFDRSVAVKGDDKTASEGYYDVTDVTFNMDIEKEWSKLYIYHEDKTNYWKEI